MNIKILFALTILVSTFPLVACSSKTGTAIPANNAASVENQTQDNSDVTANISDATTDNSGETTDNTSITDTSTQCTYIDGTYTGEGTGKNPGIKVNVTIENDKITDITVTKHYDSTDYFGDAVEKIIPQIIETQSTDVDTVTGSTLSSKGIIQAVNDALSKAAAQ
jgi:uncharacterized protein with FMN-binding domain